MDEEDVQELDDDVRKLLARDRELETEEVRPEETDRQDQQVRKELDFPAQTGGIGSGLFASVDVSVRGPASDQRHDVPWRDPCPSEGVVTSLPERRKSSAGVILRHAFQDSFYLL